MCKSALNLMIHCTYRLVARKGIDRSSKSPPVVVGATGSTLAYILVKLDVFTLESQ
jgi:hypothetical protein